MRSVYGGLVATAVLSASVCFAQVQPRPPAREGAAPPRAAVSPNDQQIAAFLSGMARNEVEISRYAQSRLKSDEAREFAEKMVHDHEPGLKKLQHAAGNLAAREHSATDKEGREEGKEERTAPREGAKAPAPAAAPPAQPGGTRVDIRVGGAQAGLDWNHVHMQLADQCLASAKEELGKKDSDEVDHCYMGQQIMAHMKAIDDFKVMRNYASAELRKDIDEAIEMAQDHLKEAKKIMEEQKDRGSERTSRKPSKQ
jgi:predicted outer membrane protein